MALTLPDKYIGKQELADMVVSANKGKAIRGATKIKNGKEKPSRGIDLKTLEKEFKMAMEAAAARTGNNEYLIFVLHWKEKRLIPPAYVKIYLIHIGLING